MIGKNKEKEFECFEDKDDSLENTLDLNPKKIFLIQKKTIKYKNVKKLFL